MWQSLKINFSFITSASTRRRSPGTNTVHEIGFKEDVYANLSFGRWLISSLYFKVSSGEKIFISFYFGFGLASLSGARRGYMPPRHDKDCKASTILLILFLRYLTCHFLKFLLKSQIHRAFLAKQSLLNNIKTSTFGLEFPFYITILAKNLFWTSSLFYSLRVSS